MSSPSSTTATWAWPVLVVSAVTIGLAPVLTKLSVNTGEVGPIAVGFWRMFLALPLLAVFALCFRGKVANKDAAAPAGSLAWLALPGLFFAGDLATWHWSFEFTSVANATLITNLSTVLLSLIGWLFLQERLSRVFPWALGLALAGAALLAFSTSGRPHHEGFTVWGDALAGCTALFYTGYLLSIKVLRRRFGAWTIMFAASAVASPVIALAAWVNGETFLPQTEEAWIYLVLLSLLVHAGGQGGIALSLKELPASGASIVLLLQPISTAILGWVILGQALVPLQYLGGLLVLSGVAAILLTRPATLPKKATPLN